MAAWEAGAATVTATALPTVTAAMATVTARARRVKRRMGGIASPQVTGRHRVATGGAGGVDRMGCVPAAGPGGPLGAPRAGGSRRPGIH
ncbi:hypothetical protein GCM10023322_82430 [Rugosimonospora acidiphila]|uniref:Uncharacterized protein n=1 Tax=Rugosimonospora acidiphila TaxID=556531 RepID=A0ABP9SW25_9ACTN